MTKDSVHSLPAADTVAADSAVADTVVHDTTYVMLIGPSSPAPMPMRPVADGGTGMSWIVGGLLLLFVVVAIRFHNNSKYIGALLKSAVEVRERGNVFDDTVRETSFMVLLNVMWSLCAGILLYAVTGGRPGDPGAPLGMAFGMALCFAYEVFMVFAYWMVGNIFSDALHTRMWVRGFLSATGLTVILLFPAVLLLLCYPAETKISIWIGLGAFLLGKIVFIWKGFRIFFTQIGAWLLFLYYLCSLEIVPLILLYVSATEICR